MNDYTKGILTGASLVLCFFMLVSAKSQSKNLGHITVNSVDVVDENGESVGLFGSVDKGGFLMLYESESESGLVLERGHIITTNADGKIIANLGTGEYGGGYLTTYNADGKMTVSLGTNEDGLGQLRTYNKHEVMTGFFGTNTQNDGIAMLHDRYGDLGWGETGKK